MLNDDVKFLLKRMDEMDKNLSDRIEKVDSRVRNVEALGHNLKGKVAAVAMIFGTIGHSIIAAIKNNLGGHS